jgi:2-(1,2-epoxy-1,2-dihydrophenyl)acetyl-CoA isomerase
MYHGKVSFQAAKASRVMNLPPGPGLVFQREGSVARLRFNRPQSLNAIDASVALAFRDACRSIKEDPAIRVVILSGEGRAFMAGGDIAQFRDSPQSIASSIIEPMHEGLLILTNLPAPVVASVHGAVAGGGMSLALACDFVVAAEGTRFSFAYLALGTSCDLGASWTLPRLVGLRRALDIAMSSETIDAPTALSLGLVNRVVPAAALGEETERFAVRLSHGPPLALGLVKRLMRQSFERDLPSQLSLERDAFQACAESHDFREGVLAFLDKRRPQFQGR